MKKLIGKGFGTAAEILETITNGGEIEIKVAHDRFPENEILINADTWCDYCSTKYPEDMTRMIGDLTLCDGCYDNATE